MSLHYRPLGALADVLSVVSSLSLVAPIMCGGYYIILILIEDQLMLFMFYLEKRKIVACNMLAKLVDF